MDKFYTCRYDVVFKEVFGKENNKDIVTGKVYLDDSRITFDSNVLTSPDSH